MKVSRVIGNLYRTGEVRRVGSALGHELLRKRIWHLNQLRSRLESYRFQLSMDGYGKSCYLMAIQDVCEAYVRSIEESRHQDGSECIGQGNETWCF